MAKRIINLLLLGLLFCSGGAFAQEDGDISQYLDDDRITNATRLLMVNPGALLAGDLPVTFEQLFLKRLGVEVGAGVILPFYIWELWSLRDAFPNGAVQKPGYSLYFSPKYYLTKRAPEHHFFGAMFRRRQYNFEGAEPVIVKDYTINYGLNRFIRDRYILGFNTGFGIGTYGERSLNGTPFDGFRFVTIYLIKFGLVF